eukprot:s241_g7.t1
MTQKRQQKEQFAAIAELFRHHLLLHRAISVRAWVKPNLLRRAQTQVRIDGSGWENFKSPSGPNEGMTWLDIFWIPRLPGDGLQILTTLPAFPPSFLLLASFLRLLPVCQLWMLWAKPGHELQIASARGCGLVADHTSTAGTVKSQGVGQGMRHAGFRKNPRRGPKSRYEVIARKTFD